jgi:hypothetical protein
MNKWTTQMTKTIKKKKYLLGRDLSLLLLNLVVQLSCELLTDLAFDVRNIFLSGSHHGFLGTTRDWYPC